MRVAHLVLQTLLSTLGGGGGVREWKGYMYVHVGAGSFQY